MAYTSSGDWRYLIGKNVLQNTNGTECILTAEIESALVDYEVASGYLEQRGIFISDIQDVFNVINDAKLTNYEK